jgi:hypothetical protein
MLSAAKHLLVLTGNKQEHHIPSLRSGHALRGVYSPAQRGAQNDVGGFFGNPPNRRVRISPKASFLVAPLLLAGCSRAPSFDILGSFFPAWLVCLAVAILLTFFARWLLLRLHIAVVLPILVYPSLTALFAFALWLIFFR